MSPRGPEAQRAAGELARYRWRGIAVEVSANCNLSGRYCGVRTEPRYIAIHEKALRRGPPLWWGGTFDWHDKVDRRIELMPAAASSPGRSPPTCGEEKAAGR